MNVSDFDRRELQKMAKQYGIRANAKSTYIFDELKKLGAFNITTRKRRKKSNRSHVSQNINPNATSGDVKRRRPAANTVSRSATIPKASCAAVSSFAARPKAPRAADIIPDHDGIRGLLGRILPSFRDIEKHYTLIKQLGDVRDIRVSLLLFVLFPLDPMLLFALFPLASLLLFALLSLASLLLFVLHPPRSRFQSFVLIKNIFHVHAFTCRC